eukprot:TRINITY_DN2663_c0_g1_i1.p1 TRINITY_DN2663_c0_g1~~TRINITY_DN2663_c0_g1_i1.p1  ORF type:complete len:254 (-),score=35.29 TRINITY_DN2663_c0_g1_i1:291-974(-)
MSILKLVIALIAIFAMCEMTLAKKKGGDNYDYLLFVQEWPSTLCNYGSKSCLKNAVGVDFFTVHGLWPERNDGSWPQFCSGQKWDPQQVEPLRADMNKLWPSFYGDFNSFWDHEWSKHGTCMAKDSVYVHDLFQYFNATIGLRKTYDFYYILSQKQIVPDDKARYELSSITNAVEGWVGAKPAITCKKGELDTIVLCVDKSLDLQDCNSHLSHGCGEYVGYPTAFKG